MSESRIPADFVPLHIRSHYANLSQIAATSSPYNLAGTLHKNGYQYFPLTETMDNGFVSLGQHFDASEKEGLVPVPGIELSISPDWGTPQRALCLARDNEGLAALFNLQNRINLRQGVVHPGDIQKQKGHMYAILLGPLVPRLENILATIDNVFLGVEQPGEQRMLPRNLQRKLQVLHKLVVVPDIRMATLSEEEMLFWLARVHDDAGVASDRMYTHALPTRVNNSLWSEYWDMVDGLGITKELVQDVHVRRPKAMDIRPATMPEGWTSEKYLREITLRRLAEHGLYDLRERVEEELKVITKRERFSSAIITALEVSEFFRVRQIPFTPTGSADNSVVLAVLGQSRLNPREVAEFDFSRFISFARVGLPDMDMMIPYDREVVTQLWEYLRKLYGGRVYEIVSIHHMRRRTIDEYAERFNAPVTEELAGQLLAAEIPFRRTKHASKVVFADTLPVQEGLSEHGVPVALMNKDDIEKHFDLFPLDLLERQGPQRELLASRLVGKRRMRTFSPDDAAVLHDIFSTSSNYPLLGIPNIESPHMGNMIARIGEIVKSPTRKEIARAESLARLGREIRERHYRYVGEGKANLSNEAVLALGLKDPVIDTQEGLLKIGKAAGFSEKDRDKIRKMLSDSGITVEEKLEVLAGISQGLEEKGFSEHVRGEVVRQIWHFVGYAFVEGHAQALADEAYRVAWYRTYYPKEFWASVLTTVADKPETLPYRPQSYINEALRYARKGVGLAFSPDFREIPEKPILKNGNIIVSSSMLRMHFGGQPPGDFAQMYGEWLDMYYSWKNNVIDTQTMVRGQQKRFGYTFTHNPVLQFDPRYWFDKGRDMQFVIAEAVAARPWKDKLMITCDAGEFFRADIGLDVFDAKTLRHAPYLRIEIKRKGNNWNITDVIGQSDKMWEL